MIISIRIGVITHIVVYTSTTFCITEDAAAENELLRNHKKFGNGHLSVIFAKISLAVTLDSPFVNPWFAAALAPSLFMIPICAEESAFFVVSVVAVASSSAFMRSRTFSHIVGLLLIVPSSLSMDTPSAVVTACSPLVMTPGPPAIHSLLFVGMCAPLFEVASRGFFMRACGDISVQGNGVLWFQPEF